METINSSDDNIVLQTEEYPEAEILESLHPFVREWFTATFPGFSPPQKYAIGNIQRGINSLISSPTGTGKTLSSFLAILNELVTKADTGTLEDNVHCIYISPLKALANDINKNLKEPLDAIQTIAEKYQRRLNIRIGTRTGDTTTAQKNAMLTKPPHILLTTPESLAIVLSSTKFSQLLTKTKHVIIDEIHALAENKRGIHLNLSIERLAKRATFTRIGLSATVAPLEEVAKFLAGYQDPKQKIFRPCRIVDVQYLKKLDLKVLSPVDDMMNTNHTQLRNAQYALLHDLIQSHRTTLIFTNTRSGTERVVHQLRDRYPASYANVLDADEEKEILSKAEGLEHEHLEKEAEINNKNADEISKETKELKKEVEKMLDDIEREKIPVATTDNKRKAPKNLIGAHHGSLSKAHRVRIENMLKAGELKSVVCSTSLELGIDIGYIDLVILLGSPKSVARALQRIGRSGHKLHDEAKGRIVVLDRDDLVECSVLLKAAIEKKIDKLHIPKNALDVLAQHLYGMAIEDVTGIEDAWHTITSSYAYDGLTRKDFDETLNYLAGNFAELTERHVYAKIWLDKNTTANDGTQGVFGKKGKLARLIYMTNIGTIPDETSVQVKIGGHTIGTITEEFSERLKPGDIFILGGDPYEFKYTRGMTAQVITSAGRMPTVPNWISEMLPLSYDLAIEIQTFRKYMQQWFDLGKSKDEVLEWIRRYLYVDERGVRAIYQYFEEQYKFSSIPLKNKLLLEHFKDGNKKYVFIHAVYGRRVNDVLSRAIAYINGKLTGRDVEVGITDNGFYLKSTQSIQALRAMKLLKEEDLQRLMDIAIDKSEIQKRRFRHCAGRGMMILRQYKGQQKSVGRQQISSQLIMSAVKKISNDFPILKETRREILEDFMDIVSAKQVVRQLQEGTITIEEFNTSIPSPFAFNMVIQGYVDILKMEDRIEFVRRMHRLVLEHIDGGKKSDGGLIERTVDEGIPNEKKIKDKKPLLPAYTFTYDDLLREQEEEKIAVQRKKKENYTEYLRDQLKEAARRIRLDADIYYQVNRLIDEETEGFPSAFKEWLHILLQGTVPKMWKDDLVKFLKEKERML